MSDRPYFDSIGAVRTLRPTEDLSLLHIDELRRLFETATLTSIGLAEPFEPESFRPVSAPLGFERPEPSVCIDDAASPHAATSIHRPAASEGRSEPAAPANPEPPRRDWLLDPEPIPAPVEPQPYGDDPTRLRELVQWFADGRAASASVLVHRAAGDLVDVPPETRDRPGRIRAVLPSGRMG